MGVGDNPAPPPTHRKHPPPQASPGSPGVLKYPYCHQMITQTHPKGVGRD